MQFVAPIKWEEAIAKIGDKNPIGSQLSSAEWRNVPIALRERAFFSSTIESLRFLQRAKDSLTEFEAANKETLPSGQTILKTGSRQEFVRQMQNFAVSEGMGSLVPDAKRGGLQDITSEKRLGLIFDVQDRAAKDYGYWKQGMDRDVLDAYPAQRFVRIQEVQDPREYHRQFEGEVRLKTDFVFWGIVNQDFGVQWGPWGWGCGHDVEDVDREEAEGLGLIKPGEQLQRVEKDFNDSLQASAHGLDNEVLGFLQESFGDLIEIDEEEQSIRWRKKNGGQSTRSEFRAKMPQGLFGGMDVAGLPYPRLQWAAMRCGKPSNLSSKPLKGAMPC